MTTTPVRRPKIQVNAKGTKKTKHIKTRQGGNGDDDDEGDKNKEEYYSCIKYQNLSRDISVPENIELTKTSRQGSTPVLSFFTNNLAVSRKSVVLAAIEFYETSIFVIIRDIYLSTMHWNTWIATAND